MQILIGRILVFLGVLGLFSSNLPESFKLMEFTGKYIIPFLLIGYGVTLFYMKVHNWLNNIYTHFSLFFLLFTLFSISSDIETYLSTNTVKHPYILFLTLTIVFSYMAYKTSLTKRSSGTNNP